VTRRSPAAPDTAARWQTGGIPKPQLCNEYSNNQRPTYTQYTMHCPLFNARSLLNKLPELYHVLYGPNVIDCLCVTESWLHDGITDGLLDPKLRYNIIRNDRHGAKGGGVCVFVQKKFTVHTVQPRCMPKGVEFVCFDLPEFSVVYRVYVVY